MAPQAASAAVTALFPLVVGGFRRRAEQEIARGSSVRALAAMLEELGGGRMAAQVMGPDPIHAETGRELACRLFGSDAAISTVVRYAADRNQLDPDEIGRMLPPLTMLIGGYFAARAEALPPGMDEGHLRERIAHALEMNLPNPLDQVLPPGPAA